MDHTTLVSVIVITYNSALTVLETLESAKNQDYPDVELIVADDCSKDDTVSIVRDWMGENGSRFVHSELVTSTMNTGVSGNLNRGLAKARGNWIKVIAGDDMLMPDCVSVNLASAKSDDGLSAVFSRARFFGDAATCKQFENFGYGIWGLNNRERYLILLTYNTIIAPAAFVRRNYLDSVGGYNEAIPFIEDWPFWIRMFKDDCRVCFINRETVKYRMGSSLSLGSGGGGKFKDSYNKVLDYAFGLQMQENFVYKIYAVLSKKQREKHSLWYSVLIRLNVYHYYYKYLNNKLNRASERFNNTFNPNANSLV